MLHRQTNGLPTGTASSAYVQAVRDSGGTDSSYCMVCLTVVWLGLLRLLCGFATVFLKVLVANPSDVPYSCQARLLLPSCGMLCRDGCNCLYLHASHGAACGACMGAVCGM